MKATLDRFFDEEGSRLICARRPGQGTNEDEKALLTREEVRRYEASLTVVDVDGAEGISSTKVRDAVQTGDEPTLERMLVPEVKAYIDEESLYR